MKYISCSILLFCLLALSGCGTVFGGYISDYQRSPPRKGEAKRQIRPAALAADIVLGLLVVDLIDGGIYKPCTTKPANSLAIKRWNDSIQINDSLREHKSSLNALIFSTDGMQYITMQPNVSLEYTWHQYALGIYVGLIIPSSGFAVNPFADGQYTDPGTVYNGWAFKFYYKYYDKYSPKRYWCVQLSYKPEWFGNQFFLDEAIPDEADVSYTMSEKANIYGLDILRGYELVTNSAFHLDFFFGVGLHVHAMNFDVTSLEADYPIMHTNNGYADGRNYISSGNNTLNVMIPTPVIGLKVGFDLFKKPEVTRLSNLRK